MKFKYYLTTDNIDESLNFYKSIFNEFTIDKNNNSHVKFTIYDSMTFLINNMGSSSYKPGYLILRFEKGEENKYEDIRNNLINNGVRLSFDNYKARWGTTFTEFVCPAGYSWVIEKNS